ncbi:transglycosylase domain-containing protein, partial [Mycobacterium sp.]
MNNEGHQDQSAADNPNGTGADRGPTQPPRSPRRTSQRPAVPPDDRLTTILPPVRDDRPDHLRDPIEEVKAALGGRSSDRDPERDPLEMATAALEGKTPLRHQQPTGGPRGGRPPLPDWGWLQRIDWSRLDHINWTWVRRGLYLSVVVILLLPIVTFAMAYFIVDIPKPGDIRTNQVSTILASDGSELAKIVPPEGNRVDVNLDQVPVHVRQAVIAAEDRNFYSNPGFSFTGFARAIKNNIFGGDTQGGSTITQQYVKNALVGAQRAGIGGLVRKAKELVIATKMSGEWSKDDVLQAYLNIIYFGRGAYGISAASMAYFGKPVEQLTVADGALLAALIQRPSTLDPAVDLEGATHRWNWVLDGMVEIKALPATDRAAQLFPPTVPPEQARARNHTTGPNGLIQRQVTRELLDLFNIDEQTLNTQGLQITTAIDPQAQKAAEDAVSKYMDGQKPDMRTAVVSIDPRNGAVKAYYGGSDANGFDFAQAGLQTGSSFKVFALIAA